MNKIHNLEIYKKLSAVNMYNKLDEEVKEVAGAILMNDKENLTEELLDVIQCCYGIAFTKGINLEEHIKGMMYRNKLTTGTVGYFKKGSTPWNKGLKGYMGANKTSFKKGTIPPQYRPVGSERITKDGYIEIKVEDPNKWELKHRVIWEQHNGEIPKGYAIIFADGDKSNLDIDNLLLVSRKQLLFMNRNNLRSENKEFTKVGVNIANVMIKLSEIESKN